MNLVVLGSSASMPAPGDACSGYLVSSGDTHVLLDCGTGVISALQNEIALASLSAIVISHFHPDHFIDLVPLRYGLRYGPGSIFHPHVFLPPGGISYLEQVGRGLRDSEDYFTSTYNLNEYDPAQILTIGDLQVSFCRTTHDIPTYAIAVSDGDDRLVYTADTQESKELVAFSREADVLLCESTYPSTLENLPSGNHLTSQQAGELASQAQAGQLVLTHFWPGIDRSDFQADAVTAFDGEIHLAKPGLTLAVRSNAERTNHAYH